jgi:hypothetical protein
MRYSSTNSSASLALTVSLVVLAAAAAQTESPAHDRVWERPSRFCYLFIPNDVKHPEKGEFVPGYCEKDANVLHRWKGVAFPVEKCIYTSPYDGMLVLDEKADGLKIVEYDPVPIYLKLDSGKAAVGYYGLGRRDFYRWKDVVVEQSEIPDEALKAENRVFPAGHFKKRVTEIDAPKHLLEKPELWKKVK